MPYTSLRAFEAMARHGSFSAAADELGVSQSAISQHVKALEEWLGHQLITRGPRRSEPTRDGARLAHAITEGLTGISDVCEAIRDKHRADNKIVISCSPGLAFIWLFPRLMRFDIAHPHLSISIATDTGVDRFSAAQADVGIRYGMGDNPGFLVEPLMDEDLFPVCAPSLADGPHPLRQLADLTHHTQLRDEFTPGLHHPPNWEFWARENGLNLPAPARIRRFGQSNMVVQAAIEGVGVALGRGPLVLDALRDGKLVRPFPQTARSRLKYWLVYSEAVQTVRGVSQFIDWIKSEASRQPMPADPTTKSSTDQISTAY